MRAVVIKFADKTYYAGCNKRPSKTLLGAQLYKSKATAENVLKTSINFPHYHSNPVKIVEVEINEVGNEC